MKADSVWCLAGHRIADATWVVTQVRDVVIPLCVTAIVLSVTILLVLVVVRLMRTMGRGEE